MEAIKTNQNALEQRILSEVKRAFLECKESAEQGRKYTYFTTDKDIYREVRDKLETDHKIFIPTIISKYSPSHPAVEHFLERTEMKLTWRN